jgi:uridine kinase
VAAEHVDGVDRLGTLVQDVRAQKLASASGATAIVAVSGFGGAGKSTLATELRDVLRDVQQGLDVQVVSADDFIVGRMQERSHDWASVDRARLREQVLEPAHSTARIRYQRYDWPSDELADWRELVAPHVLIIEGVGILHPDLVALFDLTVWVDVPLDLASERGRRRDKDTYGVDHDAQWRDIWAPNDAAFAERFGPRETADILFAASGTRR